jgi:hypothetical protein
MRAAFIIKGPPTYMNAEEARYHYGIGSENSVLFIVIPQGNPHQRKERLLETIEPACWSEIVWVETETNVSFELQADGHYKKIRQRSQFPIAAYRRDARLLKGIAARYGRFQRVFTVPNEVHEHLAWCLHPEELHLLDTGNKTPSRVTRTGYIDYRQSASRLKRLSQTIGGMRVHDRQRTSLFTAYADLIETRHHVVTNSYALQKQRFHSKELSDTLVWIGGPFCDRFGVDVNHYIAYIRSGLERLAQLNPKNRPDRVIYIPHPGKESETTLTAVRHALNCQIDNRLLPVELKIAQLTSLPRAIISHFSSSLTNLASVLDARVMIASAWHPEFGHFRNLTGWRSTLESGDSGVQFIDMTGCPSLLGLGEPDQTTVPCFANLYAYRDSRGNTEKTP